MAHSEESLRTTASHTAIFNLSVFSQIFNVFNALFHLFFGQKRSQIGRIRRNDNHSEKPPGCRCQTSRNSPLNRFQIHFTTVFI